MLKPKSKSNFKEPGGVIVLPIRMLDSLAYQHLSAKAAKLLSLMQRHWRKDKAVDYGITCWRRLKIDHPYRFKFD